MVPLTDSLPSGSRTTIPPMGAVTRFVDHAGHRIFEVHFENLTAEQAIAAMDEAKTVIAACPPASLLALTYVSGARFDPKVSQALRDFTAHNRPFVRRSAVVGLSGIQKALLSGIRIGTGRDIRGFDDPEEARAWLVTE